ncbi:MAG: energy transducer TonB [Nitrospina sp.]|nr:energy transducer TonB [Nitrospina sp.]MBT6716404.1 energy transducer TonB [Nitrospina sp.]
MRKRKTNWFENSLLNRTRLSGFLLLSLGVHITFVITHMLIPVQEKVKEGPPPIQVKYFETKKPLDSKPGKIVDTPKPPAKPEKPKTEELLAKFDSRSHSNKNITPKKVYKRKKTVVPKSKGTLSKTGSNQTQTKKIAPEKKFRKQSHLKPRKKTLPESDIGTFKSITPEKMQKTKPSSAKKSGAGSTLALLDGFDADKFASLDTDSVDDSDDDEPVSLDTTEVKYASYFARIKHQIERVWIYPSDAAQRGISGDLSLKFRISKDGNLMGVRIIDQSGYEILDVAALKAVKEAAPFYPFPKNIQREKITILANFVYTPNFEPAPR